MTSSACDQSHLKARSSQGSWLTSWWKSREDPKRHIHSFGINPCDCGFEQMKMEREDLQLPVFTTKVAPTSVIGKHINGNFSLPPRELKLSDLKRTSILSSEDDDGESNSLSLSSYELSHSSSMTPLLPMEPMKSTNRKKKSRGSQSQIETRAEICDDREKVSETLIDLIPSREELTFQDYSFEDQNKIIESPEEVSESPPSDVEVPHIWYQNFPSSFKLSAGNFFNRLHSKPSVPPISEMDISYNDRKVNRDELLRLFILKLEEEANYFDTSPSPDDELCECSKCQEYYGEYYARYLEEYHQKYGSQLAGQDIEISILMGDLMNNGMNLSCSIM